MSNWIEENAANLARTTICGPDVWRVALSGIFDHPKRDELVKLMVSITHNNINPVVLVEVLNGLAVDPTFEWPWK